MSSHLVFNDCDDTVKASLETYWAKKLPRLEKILVPYRPDLQDTCLAVYHHAQNSHRSRYEIRGAIHLPTGALAAEANDKDPHVALDQVVDTLITELKRHKELVRRDYLFKRKTRQLAELDAAQQALAERLLSEESVES